MAKVQTDFLKKIIQTEMAGGAIPLNALLYMTLNFADLGRNKYVLSKMIYTIAFQ